jgi:uncharacterized membrane protein
MRCTRLPIAVFCLTLAGSFAYAQTPAPAKPASPPATTAAAPQATTAKKPLTPQQQKMSDCSKEAKAEKLAGAKRTEFMKSCLSSDPETAKKTLTAQQEKMKKCNADATGKKGAERKKFMSECLKAA